jgi:two-component system OmpR family sensor kinase
MARIGGESERLNGLVNDMLQLAREAPPAESLELIDTGDIVHVVVDDLRAAHPELPIELEIAPDTNCTVLGRSDRLHQAILNVGSNACQHTEPPTGVRFRISSTETSLIIEVIDHGPGIDPAEVDKIFLPFYRPETSRTRDGGGGAGLGLAIAGQILERHHGVVTAGETPGGGATFILRIPLASQ